MKTRISPAVETFTYTHFTHFPGHWVYASQSEMHTETYTIHADLSVRVNGVDIARDPFYGSLAACRRAVWARCEWDVKRFAGTVRLPPACRQARAS